MNREQRVVRVGLREDDLCPRLLEHGADGVGALGQLVARDRHADPHGALRIVEPVLVRPRDGDREGHALPGEAVLGSHVGRQVRRRRASRGREHTDDRQLAVGARVLDDVDLPRPEAERRAWPELLGLVADV